MGAGVIVNGLNNALITPANPAHVGDVVVLYCNGLGAVNPPVPTSLRNMMAHIFLTPEQSYSS